MRMKLLARFVLGISGIAFGATLFSNSVANALTLPARVGTSGISVQLMDADVYRPIGMANTFELLDQAGFKMIRKGLAWGDIESKRGVYDFTQSDKMIADQMISEAEDRGVYVIMTLSGTNKLYANSADGGITTAESRIGFARFAAAAARRYRGKNIIFEIWNEPNLQSFWRGPSNSMEIADEYAALVKVVIPAMRAADKSAYIVVGAMSGIWDPSMAWLDRCIKQGMLKTDINGFSVHPYGFNWPERSIDDGYGVLRKRLAAAGRSDLDLVNSEVGYPRSWIEKRQGYPAEQSEAVQGWMFVRQQMVDLMTGVKFSNWYKWRSDASYALYDMEYDPRSTLSAMKVLSQELDGYRYISRFKTESSRDFVVLFQNKKLEKKLVAWTTADPTLDAADRQTKSRRIEMIFDTLGSGPVAVTNTFGTKGSVGMLDGLLAIQLGGAPKYLDLSKVGPAESRNVALKKDVIVSSNQARAKNLVDGNVSDLQARWISSVKYPQTVEVDLGRSFEVTELRYLQDVQRTDDYRIEYFDGAWKAIAGVRGNKLLNISRSFAPVRATKMRLTILSGSGAQGAHEIQIIGSP